MGTRARCRLCGETITYYYNDAATLIEHFQRYHQYEEVVYYECDSNRNDVNLGSCGDIRQQKKFKTTVETWNQGPNLQKCPYCFKLDTPLIRKQRNKIARTSLGALLLLGCWPLCFLPFMLGGSDILNLYCKHCGNYIASYDRRNGCICTNGGNRKLVDIPKLC